MNPYPAEEKAKMDAIMAAFKPYIDAHYYAFHFTIAECRFDKRTAQRLTLFSTLRE